MTEPIHLAKRDRIAIAHRLIGAVLGFAMILVAFATSSWGPWTIGLLVVIIGGGPPSYYLLTSIVRCPSCSKTVSNFRIGSPESKRKVFSCKRCGAESWLAEGFYWQSETAG